MKTGRAWGILAGCALAVPLIGQVLPQPAATTTPAPAPGGSPAAPAAPGGATTGGTTPGATPGAPTGGAATNAPSAAVGMGGFRGLMVNNGYCVFMDNCGVHRFIGNSCANPRGPMRMPMEVAPPGAAAGPTPHRRLGGYTGTDYSSYRSMRISLRGYPFLNTTGLLGSLMGGAPAPAGGTTPGGAGGNTAAPSGNNAGNNANATPAAPGGGAAAAVMPAGGNNRPAPVPQR